MRYVAELEELYEQYSRWLDDVDGHRELDARDIAVVRFAGSLLKRTLSDSFAGVPLTEGHQGPLGQMETDRNRTKLALVARSLSLELARHKHRLTSQLVSCKLLFSYSIRIIFCLFLARQPAVCQGLLIYEVSRSHTNDTPQLVGLLWTSDQLIAETSTSQRTTLTTDRHPCPPVGFEPTISAGKWLQTYALQRTATGISIRLISLSKLLHYYIIQSSIHPLVNKQLICV
jgi:hypothetical protein